MVVYLDLKSRTFHHKPKYDFKKYLIKMANVANAVVNALGDWRDEPTMDHQNCLALKICAIIQVFSMFKTYNLRVGSMFVVLQGRNLGDNIILVTESLCF